MTTSDNAKKAFWALFNNRGWATVDELMDTSYFPQYTKDLTPKEREEAVLFAAEQGDLYNYFDVMDLEDSDYEDDENLGIIDNDAVQDNCTPLTLEQAKEAIINYKRENNLEESRKRNNLIKKAIRLIEAKTNKKVILKEFNYNEDKDYGEYEDEGSTFMGKLGINPFNYYDCNFSKGSVEIDVDRDHDLEITKEMFDKGLKSVSCYRTYVTFYY